MSALDLDAIEARAAAATLGPWIAYRPAEYRHDYRIATTAPEMNRNREWYVGRLTRSHENEAHPSLHDAEFIAAARSDVPALVALARAQSAEIATLRAAYATDLDGLRAELRRADDERATWRERIERLQRETLRLRSLIPAVAFIRCPSCGTDRDAELDDDAVYVMRRHPRRTTRDEMAWCDGGVVSETKP